jgi:Carbohydrate binding module (family 6)/Bacterial Ig-like domain (group 2)/Cellulase (glycosyl hydrolase family 5)/Secretion system C-terminal sorting domain
MKNILRCLLAFILCAQSMIQTNAQTLNCRLNIDATGRYFQIGPPGGTNPRWVMKGVHSVIMHLTPSSGDPTGWECGSLMINNWNNRDAQLTTMRNYGINCVRIWMPGPVGRDNPNPSYTGTTMNQHYDEIVSYISLCKSKGLFVLVEDWYAGYVMTGNTADSYRSGEWFTKMSDFIRRLAAAGCDNVMFGTGNEPGEITNQFGVQFNGAWKDNTKLMIAAYREIGFNGPILVDGESYDNVPGNVFSYAEIQNSDPSRNVGFQEHEYMNFNYAANGYFILPIARLGYNNGLACENFPIFATEYAFVNDGINQTLANLAINNNWGGGCYFWYNGCFQPAATNNGDGINLSGEGLSVKNNFWNAPGIPGGYYPTGSTIPVSGVSVSPTTATIGAGTTTQLSSSVSPGNATINSVKWSTSNAGVATVSSSGLVTGVSAGTATVTVTTDDGGKTAACSVTVTGSSSNTTIVNIGNSSDGITYGGAGFFNTRAGDINNDERLLSNGTGFCEYTFTGTGVDVIGYKDQGSQYAANYTIYIDGSAAVSGNTSSATNQFQTNFGSVSGLSNGQHTVRVAYTSSIGSSGLVILDAFRIYGGSVVNSGSSIPGKIEAESFSSMSGIQTEGCRDIGGGSNVGYTDTGDFMNYAVSVSSNGSYTVDLRVASPLNGSQIQIKSGGTVLATVNIPNTGDWQNWQTVTSSPFNLSAGSQTIQVYVSVGGWNLNYLQFNAASTVSSGSAIPGKIEAESYSSMSGIQTEDTRDIGGGSNVGYTDTGDFMNYAVNVSSSGSYTVDLRMASPLNGSQIQIKSGGTVLATVNVPNTGDWQNWQTVTSSPFNLSAGSQTLQIYVSVGGWNLNYMQFNASSNASNNLALNRTYGSSSDFNADQTAPKGCDGLQNTDWQGGLGTPYGSQYLFVNFGSPVTFNKVVMSEYGNRTSGYRIEYSSNGTSWQTAYTGTTIGASTTVTFSPVTGNFARIQFTSGTGTPIIYEFEIYNTGATGTAHIAKAPAEQNPALAKPVISVYPNPVNNDVLNIRVDGQLKQARVFVYNLNGVKQFEGLINKGETKRITKLTPGVYFVKVAGEDINEVRKIVVIK